ncbi:MAG TPA: DUF559 domain-containing protein [Allosphingosinicella sp.]|jgi:very-short-patch-repair endonuclease
MKRRIPKRTTDRARALRNEATPQERVLWALLSRYRPKFTRQLSIPPYIADLACRRARLIVEIDGSQHLDPEEDADRTQFLESEGWTIIRFWNSEVNDNPERCRRGDSSKGRRVPRRHPPPTPPWKGGAREAAASREISGEPRPGRGEAAFQPVGADLESRDGG